MCRNICAILILAVLVAMFCGCATNPITGKRELNLFSKSDDIEIGDKYAPEVEKQLGGAIPNPDLQNYVNSVGQKCAAATGVKDYKFTYTAVNDPSMNAMALPGGHIFITKGLLAKMNSEAQLAGVLAHETTHVVARHSTHQMSQQVGIDILLSAASQAGAPQGAVSMAGLATQLIGLKYSRDQEQEADMGGLDYMIAAGYSPWGMVETMKILQANSQGGSAEWLSSHPSPGNRVDYLTKAINGKRQPANPITNANDFKAHVSNNLR
jgi:beta-barrel assembly-enhancing protease